MALDFIPYSSEEKFQTGKFEERGLNFLNFAFIGGF